MKPLWVLLLLQPVNASPEPPRVALEQKGSSFHLDGEFAVDVEPQAVWDVVSDYDAIDRFVPSIESSRVLRREPDGAVIEQEGVGRFLFVSRRVKLTLAVKETPPTRLEFRKLYAPQFLDYQGSWTIIPSTDGCRVRYELDASPDASLGPQFVARRVMRAQVQRLLDEVRLEIARRRRPEL